MRRKDLEYAALGSLIETVSPRGKQLKTDAYASTGRLPIVDQGQQLIIGYTDEDIEPISDVPVVVFGDHTRIVKYIDFPFIVGADGTKLIKPNTPDIDRTYFYYLVHQAASTMDNLGYSRHFKELKEDAIEKISSLISKQKQEKHIFQTKIFSGMLIPKSHKKKNTSLYDLADWHNGLAFKNIDFSETGRPVLKIAELKSGVTSTTAFTNGKYAENVLVKSGDLLFSWSGNPDTSIDAFIWDGPEGWLNQHIFRVVPKPDLQKEYLYQFLRHIKNRLAYIATGKQSTGLGHVTKADMKRTYLVLPDMDDQIKISGLLNNFDVLIFGLERQKKIFQSQKRGLMQKLLTGEWRVNVSGDAEAA